MSFSGSWWNVQKIACGARALNPSAMEWIHASSTPLAMSALDLPPSSQEIHGMRPPAMTSSAAVHGGVFPVP